MLQLTPPAAALLRDTRDQQDVPGDYSIRISAQPDEEGELRIDLSYAEEPEEGDEIVEQEDLKLYVAQEVVEPLAGHVLGVGETPDGGRQLVIRPQEPEEGSEE